MDKMHEKKAELIQEIDLMKAKLADLYKQQQTSIPMSMPQPPVDNKLDLVLGLMATKLWRKDCFHLSRVLEMMDCKKKKHGFNVLRCYTQH